MPLPDELKTAPQVQEALLQLLLTGLEVTSLLDAAAERVADLADSKRAALVLTHAGAVEVCAFSGIGRAELDTEETVCSTAVRHALDAGSPLHIADALEHPLTRERGSVLDQAIGSVVCVPIPRPRGEAALGVVYVDRRVGEKPLPAETAARLTLFARFAAPLLNAALERHLELRSLAIARRRVTELELKSEAFAGLTGGSPAISGARERLARCAGTDLPVVIEGESGTGKDLAARGIHAASARAERPFVSVNCGAVAESVMESELFGHVKGAFTGADADRPGVFQVADGGTLFLDEIGEMPPAMQTKLLRALEAKEVRPVGASRPLPIDVRLVCATHRDLSELVADGAFREDLYYRLRVLTVRLPPLRERIEDVPLLARQFAREAALALGLPDVAIEPEVVRRLLKHPWPGNVRELRNLILGAAATAETARIDRLGVEAILEASPAREPPRLPPAILSIDEYMRYVYERERGSASQQEIADMLGIARKTLWERRKRWERAD